MLLKQEEMVHLLGTILKGGFVALVTDLEQPDGDQHTGGQIPAS